VVLGVVQGFRGGPLGALQWFFILGTAAVGGIFALAEGGSIALISSRLIEGAAVGALVGVFLAFLIGRGKSPPLPHQGSPTTPI
jgi:hypothetical protein